MAEETAKVEVDQASQGDSTTSNKMEVLPSTSGPGAGDAPIVDQPEQPVPKLPKYQYTKDQLMELSACPASRERHRCLDPSFVNAKGKWEAEKWHSPDYERQHAKQRRDLQPQEHDPRFSKKRAVDPKERLKAEEQDGIVLSPQRRSFVTGCHVKTLIPRIPEQAAEQIPHVPESQQNRRANHNNPRGNNRDYIDRNYVPPPARGDRRGNRDGGYEEERPPARGYAGDNRGYAEHCDRDKTAKGERRNNNNNGGGRRGEKQAFNQRDNHYDEHYDHKDRRDNRGNSERERGNSDRDRERGGNSERERERGNSERDKGRDRGYSEKERGYDNRRGAYEYEDNRGGNGGGKRNEGGCNNRHNRGRYHEEEEEPEWFSGGPTSKLDTIELHGFDEHGSFLSQPESEPKQHDKSDSSGETGNQPGGRRGKKKGKGAKEAADDSGIDVVEKKGGDGSRRSVKSSPVLEFLENLASQSSRSSSQLSVVDHRSQTASPELTHPPPPPPEQKRESPPSSLPPTVPRPASRGSIGFDFNEIFNMEPIPEIADNPDKGLGGSRFRQWFQTGAGSSPQPGGATQQAQPSYGKGPTEQEDLIGAFSSNEPDRPLTYNIPSSTATFFRSSSPSIQSAANRPQSPGLGPAMTAMSLTAAQSDIPRNLLDLVQGVHSSAAQQPAVADNLKDLAISGKAKSLQELEEGMGLSAKNPMCSAPKPICNADVGTVFLNQFLRRSPTPPPDGKQGHAPFQPKGEGGARGKSDDWVSDNLVQLIQHQKQTKQGELAKIFAAAESAKRQSPFQGMSNADAIIASQGITNPMVQSIFMQSATSAVQQQQREILASLLSLQQGPQRRTPTPPQDPSIFIPIGGIPMPTSMMNGRVSPRPPTPPLTRVQPSVHRAQSPIVFGQAVPVIQFPQNAAAMQHVATQMAVAQSLAQLTTGQPLAMNPNNLQVQMPVLNRGPSPQEMINHTAAILQNALIKSQLQKQKEKYQDRNNSMPSKSMMQQQSSSMTAFTPNSVMRKMQQTVKDAKADNEGMPGQFSRAIPNQHQPSIPKPMSGQDHSDMKNQMAPGMMPFNVGMKGYGAQKQPQPPQPMVMHQQQQQRFGMSGGGRPIVKANYGVPNQVGGGNRGNGGSMRSGMNAPMMNKMFQQPQPVVNQLLQEQQQRLLLQRQMNGSPIGMGNMMQGQGAFGGVSQQNNSGRNVMGGSNAVNRANAQTQILRSMAAVNQGPVSANFRNQQNLSMQQQMKQVAPPQQQRPNSGEINLTRDIQARNLHHLLQMSSQQQQQHNPQQPQHHGHRQMPMAGSGGMKAMGMMGDHRQSKINDRMSPTSIQMSKWFGADYKDQSGSRKQGPRPPAMSDQVLSLEEVERQQATAVHN